MQAIKIAESLLTGPKIQFAKALDYLAAAAAKGSDEEREQANKLLAGMPAYVDQNFYSMSQKDRDVAYDRYIAEEMRRAKLKGERYIIGQGRTSQPG